MMFDVSAALTQSLSTLKYLRGLEYLFDTVDIVSGQQVQFEGRLLEISNLPPKYPRRRRGRDYPSVWRLRFCPLDKTSRVRRRLAALFSPRSTDTPKLNTTEGIDRLSREHGPKINRVS